MTITLIAAIASSAFNSGQSRADEAAESRAARLNAAYLQRLQRLPRPGAALDKVYEFHVDRGTLDDFVDELNAQAASDGTAQLIAGLVQQRRGNLAEAKTALAQAHKQRPEDVIPAWHLGQVLISLGEHAAATEILEAALQLASVRKDQSDIYQLLGRTYQRTQQSEQALNLWQRFEAAFPNDELVAEKIASVLVEESKWQEALVRYQSMAKSSSDPYRRIQFGTKAGDLLLKLGQREAAVQQYEDLLAQLKPGSWQGNSLRDRIERTFQQNNDKKGLTGYYEKRLQQQPDDLDAMRRLARHLAATQQHSAAREWFQKAMTKAPSDVKLREALINELTAEKDIAAAIDQCDQLTKLDPSNRSHFERWGRLVLRDETTPQAERNAKATVIWQQLLQQNPNDPVHVSGVADLFRSAGMVDKAIAAYEQAIALAPEQSQFLEYLGEYLHSLNRRDEAMATLQKMAAGDLRTTPNLTRLSSVLENFGYTAEALAAMQEAVTISPEFADHIRLAKLLAVRGQLAESIEQFDLAESLAASEDEFRKLQQDRIESYQYAGVLSEKIVELKRRLSVTTATEQQWQSLGLMQEAAGQLREAAKSLQQAISINKNSLSSWTIAARVMEKAGLLAEASAAHAQLANMDRRTQVDHLKRVAEIEQQLGRTDKAMQAAKDVVAAAPSNPETYRFFAEMCFRLGQPELAVDALRKTVRANPGDQDALTSLAEVLAKDFRTEEAIELYWRAFGKTDDLNARIGIVRNLAGLYLRTDQFDRLTVRLRSLAAQSEDRRDILQCLSNAYQAAGNSVAARDTVTELLQDNPRDRALLKEAVALSKQIRDLAKAIRYQRQLVEATSSAEDTSKLASLLLAAGDTTSAEHLWSNVAVNAMSVEQALSSVDQLLEKQLLAPAASLCEQLLTRDANNRQAMLRLAFISWKQNERDAAMAYCERIVALPLSGEPAATAAWNPKTEGELPPPFHVRRLGASLLRELGPKKGGLPGGNGQSGIGDITIPWDQANAKSVRCAAVMFQARHHIEAGDGDEFLAQLLDRATTSAGVKHQPSWDYFYAAQGTKSHRNNVAEQLQPINTPDAQLVYLYQAIRRQPNELSAIDADKLIAAYRAVTNAHPEWLLPFHGVAGVLDALKATGADAAADEIRQSLYREAASSAELYAAWELALAAKDVTALLRVADRLIEVEASSPAVAIRADTLNTLGWTFAELASLKVSENDWPAVEALVTGFLSIKAAAVGRQQARQSQPLDSSFVGTASHRTFQDGRHTNSVRVSTLAPDERFSAADINFFVNAERLASETKWPELLSAVRNFRQQSSGNAALIAELALAHLFVLHGDKNAAAVHLVRAAELAPDDAGLRLKLANFYRQSGNDAEALALLDTVDAVDQSVMQQKESLALQLATSTGNLVRGRLAAERLFGLRLDTNTSIKLASRMRTLELDDLADALLSRIRRSQGNEIQTLESLMSQYHQQGEADVAAEIAQQILQETNTGSRRSAAAEAIRESAVRTLAELGQLDSQIDRVQKQLRQDPNAVEVLQTLVDFYKAAGRSDEAVTMAARLAEVQPNSIDHLLRSATEYEKVRNFAAASGKYLEVLRKDPQRFTQNYYQYLRTFQNARRLPELADVLLTVDLRKLNNNYYVVGETIEYLFAAASSDRKNRNTDPNQVKGLELLAAAWKTFPNERSYLLNNIRDPEIWNLPVMFDYAREGMIPSTPQQAIAKPWRGIAESPSFDSRGQIIGTLTRVLRAMPDESKRALLTTEVGAAVSKFAEWHGGKLILSVLKAKAGEDAEATKLLRQVRDDPHVGGVPTQAAWLVGAELEKCGPRFRQAATQLLQSSLDNEGYSAANGYERSAGRRLAALFTAEGQKAAARQAVLSTIEAADRVSYNEPGRKQWQQLADLKLAATDLAMAGCPLDAIGLCQRITQEMLVGSEQYKNEGFAHRQYREARELERRLARFVNQEVLIEYLTREMWPTANAPDLTDRLNLLLLDPQAGDTATLHSSILLSSLQRAAGENSDKLAAVLSKRLADHPNDTATAVATFVYADASENAALRSVALQRLQRSSAVETESTIALWFVARPLLNTANAMEVGNTLADRAESAARTFGSTAWLQVILKERGEIAIRMGDKAAAERTWARLLDVVVPMRAEGQQSTVEGEASTSAIRELRERLLQTVE